MTYNAGSRLVTSVEGAVVSTYTFDANGNQTAVNAGGSRTTYAYDYENRMRTAIDPGGARSTMAYWADGMRRFLEVGGTRTTFVWDGSDYLQSRTPSEVTTISTVDAQILDSETGGSESLLVPDPLGSVVKVLDASGNQVYDAAYWPYGEIRSSVGVNDTSWGYVGTWGYHFDTSRRLYVRARVLDPVLGRWYTVDPLWPKELAYEYAMHIPTSFIDYSGLQVGLGIKIAFQISRNIPFVNDHCSRCIFAQQRAADPIVVVGKDGSYENAHAHCTTACKIEKNCPECSGPWNYREPCGSCWGMELVSDSCRDLHNNQVGQGLASFPGQCVDLCEKWNFLLKPPKRKPINRRAPLLN